MKYLFAGFFLFITFLIGATEAVLIDFNNLEDTTIDFSGFATDSYTAEEKEMMKIDLTVPNWRINIIPSSFTYDARIRRQVLAIKDTVEYPSQTVLGIRLYFPQRFTNSHAEIMPPIEIPSYYDNVKNPDGMGSMFIYKGIVRNIGVIRKIGVRVLGNNFRYGLYVRLKNKDNERREIFIGYLNFIGWQTLTWVNPNYEKEVQSRSNKLLGRPYYPDEYPYIKFDGFIIQRIHPEITGNFVVMFKEVTIDFDEQFLDLNSTESAARQESHFGIYKQELMARTQKEMIRINQQIFLQYIEEQKMDKSPRKFTIY